MQHARYLFPAEKTIGGVRGSRAGETPLPSRGPMARLSFGETKAGRPHREAEASPCSFCMSSRSSASSSCSFPILRERMSGR